MIIRVTIIFVVLLSSAVHSFNLLKPQSQVAPRFPNSGFHLMNNMIIGSRCDQRTSYIAAFADWNGDRFSDILFVSGNKLCLNTWQHDLFKFIELGSISLPAWMGPIIDTSISDINEDGNVDAILSSRLPSGQVLVSILLGDKTEFKLQNLYVIGQSGGLPTVVDANNDMKPDLLVPSHDDQHPQFWLNNWNPEIPLSECSLPHIESKILNGSFELCGFQSSSLDVEAMGDTGVNFADVNGDCLPDIILMTKEGFVDTYVNTIDLGFLKHHQRIKIPKEAGFINIVDFDGDGALDIVYGINIDDVAAVVVISNAEPLMKDCILITGQNLTQRPLWNVEDEQSITFQSAKFVTQENFPKISLRFGDYNMDSYVDIVAVMQDTTTNAKTVTILKNVPCGPDSCNNAAAATTNNEYPQRFLTIDNANSRMIDISDAQVAAFFDFDEIGCLGLIVKSHEEVSTWFSNLNEDSLFVKAIALNGVALNADPMGCISAGSSFIVTTTDTSFFTRKFHTVQQSRSSHNSLQLAGVYMGLSANTYTIDSFTVATSISDHGERSYKTWLGLIPNSIVVAAPTPKHEPALWQLQLFVYPSPAAFYVSIVLISCLALLAAAIIALQMKERAQDVREKRSAAHLFSFDAL